MNTSIECCSICLEDIDTTKNCITTECCHCFHSNCFLKNAAMNGFSCPMCRSVLAEEPNDDESDYESDEESVIERDEVSMFALQSARWLFARAEDDPIDESEEDEDNEDDDYDFESYGSATRSDGQCMSIDTITEKLLQNGVGIKELVAIFINPHENHLQDCDTYNMDFMKRTYRIVNDILDAKI